MAYDLHLAERISGIFSSRKLITEEKKMMGGLCYMLNDKMCVGIIKNELMVRLDPEDYADTLKLPGAREMDFTGRPMKGYLIVGDEGIDSDAGLESWIDRAITFNPKAKSSKKKK